MTLREIIQKGLDEAGRKPKCERCGFVNPAEDHRCDPEWLAFVETGKEPTRRTDAATLRKEFEEFFATMFDPEHVLKELERRTKGLAHKKLNEGRQRLLEEIADARSYMRSGDAKRATIHAIRVGAWAERLGIEIDGIERQIKGTTAAKELRLEKDKEDGPYFREELKRLRRENPPNRRSFTVIMREIARENDTAYDRVRRLVLEEAIELGYKPRAKKK